MAVADKARLERLQGTVLLDVTVTQDGRAINIVVIKAPADTLGQKAVEAIKSWKFKPSVTKEGQIVASRVQIQVTFHLH